MIVHSEAGSKVEVLNAFLRERDGAIHVKWIQKTVNDGHLLTNRWPRSLDL